ncbi:MAG: GNAT family N-acetyltransferase [Verrucomicrobiae bacterium]|nr:GNAT family N-acetyltransferase [Verrucomicrobiae bacterium]
MTLRPVRADDVSTMRAWFNERELSSTWGRSPVVPENYLEADVNGRFTVFDRDGCFAVDDEHGTLIGRIDYNDLDPIDRSAEVSVMLGATSGRGKGYGTDAFHTLIDHLFSDRQVERVWLSVLPFNQPAINLYEKLGFVHEGRLRSTVWVDGTWHDLLLMGMMKSEYRPRATNSAIA